MKDGLFIEDWRYDPNLDARANMKDNIIALVQSLERIMNRRDISVFAMSKRMGESNTTAYTWFANPRVSALVKYAQIAAQLGLRVKIELVDQYGRPLKGK